MRTLAALFALAAILVSNPFGGLLAQVTSFLGIEVTMISTSVGLFETALRLIGI